MDHANTTNTTLDTYETLINLDDVVIGVYLKPLYFVEREDERANYAVGVGDAGCRFNYIDMWKDCWCLKPQSVRAVWDAYQELRRHTLPAAVAARKDAYWRREEEHEESIRGHVAKKYRIELRTTGSPTTTSSASASFSPAPGLAEALFADARNEELQVRHHTAKTLALHTALELGHDAAHGKQGSYFPLTVLERRTRAWARNELTRGAVTTAAAFSDLNDDFLP